MVYKQVPTLLHGPHSTAHKLALAILAFYADMIKRIFVPWFVWDRVDRVRLKFMPRLTGKGNIFIGGPK